MTGQTSRTMDSILKQVSAQRLRLWSGVILFVYAGTHFLNHALGLVSIDVMNAVQHVRTDITRSLPGRTVLLGSFLVHIGLNLHKIGLRKSWRMLVTEAVQIATGLAIPLLLIPHVVGMNIPEVEHGLDVDYGFALAQLWPAGATEKAVLMLVLWTHGCIGLFFNLRLRPWFSRTRTGLAVVAVLVPVLGFLGYVVAGREIADLIAATGKAALVDPLGSSDLTAIADWKARARHAVWLGLGMILCLSILHAACLRSRRRYRVTIDSERCVAGQNGQSLLDVSRMNGVGHTSVCGGRGRCSTCRVAVVEGADKLSDPDTAERRLLQSFGLGETVRLACQARPHGDVSVVRLIPPQSRRPLTDAAPDPYRWGQEKVMTVLFADIRGFTAFSETKLPFDIVFVLNRIMVMIEAEVAQQGGTIDKFMGDGAMAIFGLDGTPRAGARAALDAATAIHASLHALNRQLDAFIDPPLSIGFGIHSGPAIIGRIGSQSEVAAGQLTVIGDTVNTASRLEALCKPCGCDLVVSEDTMRLADLDTHGMETQMRDIRGRRQALRIYTVSLGETS